MAPHPESTRTPTQTRTRVRPHTRLAIAAGVAVVALVAGGVAAASVATMRPEARAALQLASSLGVPAPVSTVDPASIRTEDGFPRGLPQEDRGFTDFAVWADDAHDEIAIVLGGGGNCYAHPVAAEATAPDRLAVTLDSEPPVTTGPVACTADLRMRTTYIPVPSAIDRDAAVVITGLAGTFESGSPDGMVVRDPDPDRFPVECDVRQGITPAILGDEVDGDVRVHDIAIDFFFGGPRCRLSGAPSLQPLDASGDPVGPVSTAIRGGPASAVLGGTSGSASGTLHARFETTDPDSVPAAGCDARPVASVRVSLPNGRSVKAPFHGQVCTGAAAKVRAGAFASSTSVTVPARVDLESPKDVAFQPFTYDPSLPDVHASRSKDGSRLLLTFRTWPSCNALQDGAYLIASDRLQIRFHETGYATCATEHPRTARLQFEIPPGIDRSKPLTVELWGGFAPGGVMEVIV